MTRQVFPVLVVGMAVIASITTYLGAGAGVIRRDR